MTHFTSDNLNVFQWYQLITICIISGEYTMNYRQHIKIIITIIIKSEPIYATRQIRLDKVWYISHTMLNNIGCNYFNILVNNIIYIKFVSYSKYFFYRGTRGNCTWSIFAMWTLQTYSYVTARCRHIPMELNAADIFLWNWSLQTYSYVTARCRHIPM